MGENGPKIQIMVNKWKYFILHSKFQKYFSQFLISKICVKLRDLKNVFFSQF